MRAGRHILLGSMILCIPRAAQPQDCSKIASYGIYDTRLSVDSVEVAESFLNWFCSNEFQSKEDATNASFTGAMPVGDFITKLGFDGSKTSWEEWSANVCGQTEWSRNVKALTYVYVKEINKDVAKALETCVTKEGLHAWLTVGDDRRLFSFDANYIPYPRRDAPRYSKWTSVQVMPQTLVYQDKKGKELSIEQGKPPLLKDGVKIDAGGVSVLFKRPTDDAVQFAVSATDRLVFGSALQLKAIKPPSTRPEYLDPLYGLFTVLPGTSTAGATCPAGEVTGSHDHKGCKTEFIGYLVSGAGANGSVGRPLHEGVVPSPDSRANAGIVSDQQWYFDAATVLRGHTVTKGGFRALYVGKSPCNARMVTTDPSFCAAGQPGGETAPIGYTYSREGQKTIEALAQFALARMSGLAAIVDKAPVTR